MHMTCVICSDLLDLSENGCVINCGHLFHYVCLMQWMQRSRSCPQCRIVVTENSIIRTFPTGLSINTDQDVTLVQCQLDDALLKVKQLEAILKQRNDNDVAVKEELAKKINEVRIVEDKLRLKTDTCRIYEIRLASYIDRIKELDTLQVQNEELQSNLNALNGLQKVLNATSEEVDQMLEGYTDVRTVATFATALKRALTESEDKKKSMRSQIVQLEQEVKKLKEEKLTLAQNIAIGIVINVPVSQDIRVLNVHIKNGKKKSNRWSVRSIHEVPPCRAQENSTLLNEFVTDNNDANATSLNDSNIDRHGATSSYVSPKSSASSSLKIISLGCSRNAGFLSLSQMEMKCPSQMTSVPQCFDILICDM
ncbi:hypothetical protein ACJJTC_017229 [Scirpophaga incertulas]